MSNPTDSMFGMHTQALALWQQRSQVLANNLANADTPEYLARDIDFSKALGQASGNQLALATPSSGQIDPSTQDAGSLEYRVPLQPSMDGNTVDTEVEQAAFAGNSVHYQSSLAFITSQIHMLRTAITGGQG